jgi:lysophospholipase L1-like esterase
MASSASAQAQQLLNTRAGIAKVLNNQTGAASNTNGVNNFKVAWIGNSIALGGLAAPGPTTNGAKVLAPAFRMAQMLSSVGIPANAENFTGSQFTEPLATYTLYDPKLVSSANWAVSTTVMGFGDNNHSLNNSSTTGTLTFTPGKSCDTYDVYFFNSGNANATAQVAGGSAVNMTVGNFSKITATGTLGQPLVITPQGTAGGNLFVCGIVGYRSDIPEVSVYNLGISGAVASGFNSILTLGYSAAMNIWGVAGTFAASLQPKLTIIEFGMNDWLTAVTPAAFSTALQNIINFCRDTTTVPNGSDIILVSDPPAAYSGGPAIPLGTQQAYVATMQNLALRNNIPFVDVWTRWQSWENANLVGFENSLADGKHPTALGYRDIATAVTQILVNNAGP